MIRKSICMLLCLCFFMGITSCSHEVAETVESFYLMDTTITVTLYAPQSQADPVIAHCRSMLKELDMLWSRTHNGSDVTRLNNSQKGIAQADPRTREILKLALDVANKTGGAFDITVLPVISYWEICEKNQALPNVIAMKDCLARVGYERLAIEENGAISKQAGTQVDLGGIGKGAAISMLIEYLETTDIPGGVVSFGRNVAVFGQKRDGSDYRIALRDPFKEGEYAGVLTLSKGDILSVSGDYERFYTIDGERYHHILDPKTGYPAKSGLSSVAVVCSDGALADALSTALFVMGEDAAQELYRAKVFDFEAIFIANDGTLTQTDGMKTIFTQE